MKNRYDYKNSRVVAVTAAIGLFTGLFFLHISVQILLASVLIGIGVGLILTPVFQSKTSK